jgi:hypothetical protein
LRCDKRIETVHAIIICKRVPQSSFQSVAARRLLGAILAFAVQALPAAPLLAAQATELAGVKTCQMACCRRSGHCCCSRRPNDAAQAKLVLTAPGCPSGCGTLAQLSPIGPGLFEASESCWNASPAVAPAGEAISQHTQRDSRESALWQRPPPPSLS